MRVCCIMQCWVNAIFSLFGGVRYHANKSVRLHIILITLTMWGSPVRSCPPALA